MVIATVVLSTIILIMLILIWLRAGRYKRCRDCRHFQENYMTALHGQGLYRFGCCQRLIYDCKLVDGDVERECGYFKRKIDEKVPGDITLSDTKAAEGHKGKRPRNPKVSIFTPGKGNK